MDVDGSQQGGDGVAPVVSGLALSSTATRDTDNDGTNDTYGVGDPVDVSVTFSEAVTVDDSGGTPSLALQVGTGPGKQASYASGSASATLVFRYTVAAGDADTDGVSVAAGSVALNGGTLKDAAGNDAALAHDALAPNALHKVDGTGTPPSVTGIAFAGSAPRDADRDGAGDTYRPGDVIEVSVTFSGAVQVTGAPTLRVQVGSEERAAAFASGSGSTVLGFTYTVVAGDGDAGGVSVPENPIALNGGRIGDSAGAASLAHGGVSVDALRRVDGVAPKATGGAWVTASGSLSGGGFGLGDVMRVKAVFDEAVRVSGAPQIELLINLNTRKASYVSGSGTRELLFDYAVQADDRRDSSAGALLTLRFGSETNKKLTGGTIEDGAGNAAVRLPAQFGDRTVTGPAVDVDGSQQGGDGVAPVVSGLALSSTATRDTDNDGTNDTYGVGDPVDVSVTFSEAVTVDDSGGTPSLALQVGTGPGKQASYASGSASATLVFRYTVAAGDADTDGVSVAAGSVALNGGTLKDAAGNDAALAHDALAPNALHKVDGTLNRAPRALWAGGTGANVCAVLSDPETTQKPNARIEAPAGQVVGLTLVTRAGETTEWPASCTEAGNKRAPVFDDPDGHALTIAIDEGRAADLPENVRGFRGSKSYPFIDAGAGILRFAGVAALRQTNHDMVLSAADAHGASVTRAVRIVVGSFEGTRGRPSFAGTVLDQKLAPNAEMTALELPKATGGDLAFKSGAQTATFSHYYEVRGLPRGLTFTAPDPDDSASKPTISGTPTEEGTFTVTYTADDADGRGSEHLNPDVTDASDAAQLAFTMCVGGCIPVIELVRIVSAPTYDSDDDGKRDTFVRTDKIFVDVEFSRPVKIAGDADNVRLRLDLGSAAAAPGLARDPRRPPRPGGLAERLRLVLGDPRARDTRAGNTRAGDTRAGERRGGVLPLLGRRAERPGARRRNRQSCQWRCRRARNRRRLGRGPGRTPDAARRAGELGGARRLDAGLEGARGLRPGRGGGIRGQLPGGRGRPAQRPGDEADAGRPCLCGEPPPGGGRCRRGGLVRARRIPALLRAAALTSLVAGLLAGCAAWTPPAAPAPDSPVRPDQAETRLIEAVERAERALATLARAVPTPKPESGLPDARSVPAALRTPVTLDWTGPVEALAEELARRAGFSFAEAGLPPALPLIVAVEAEGEPLIAVLRDAGLRAGSAATLTVDAARQAVLLDWTAPEGDG